MMNTQIFAHLPDGFVYVADIDPTIMVDMRYLSDENFIGRPLAGYKKPAAILTKQAAQALRNVQQELLKEGYSLVIYDAYRPQKTVDEFVVWSKDWNDSKMKTLYYPRIDKAELFNLGYVSAKSSHTRGSTVDVSIIPVNTALKKANEIAKEQRTLNDEFKVVYLNDNTLDMGTSFDLFDAASHPDSELVAQEYRANRKYLQEKMNKFGFLEFPTEWWHFTLKNEPFPETYFNFDVE